MNDASTLFVGLRKMRSRSCGYSPTRPTYVYDASTQTASRIAAAAGAQALTSLAQVPRSADVVILMLPNSTIGESVLLGDDVSSGLLATLAPTRLAPGCWPREPRNAAPHRARPLQRRYERCHFHDTTKPAAKRTLGAHRHRASAAQSRKRQHCCRWLLVTDGPRPICVGHTPAQHTGDMSDARH